MLTTTSEEPEAESQDTVGAQALESASSALAGQVLSTTGFCNVAEAGYEAMQTIVKRAFRAAAREWNREHDHLRVLPAELRNLCWSYLSPSDMLRLLGICHSWRELSRDTPLLWTHLRLSGAREDLHSMLALSADIPLSVDLWGCLPQHLHRVDQGLRAHARRLQRLRITLTGAISPFIPGDDSFLLFPAPKLESFTLQTSRDAHSWAVFPKLFNENAPSLHSVTLCDAALPESCTAFKWLSYLKLEGNCGPLDRLYRVAPHLEELELVRTNHLGSLPITPNVSLLLKVSFLHCELPFSTLDARRYFHVPELLVSTQQSVAVLRGAACECPRDCPGTLTLSDAGPAALELRHPMGGINAAFVATAPPPAEVCAMLCDSGRFHTIERLVLPAELSVFYEIADGGRGYSFYPYLLPDGLFFEALRTLTLLCAPRGRCSLLDPDTECGLVTAPRLQRIELSRHPQAEDAGDAVDPCHLALFIEEHISCDDQAALEVLVDATGGVLLECRHRVGGLARLQACIGNLILC